jgi:hypothetical protein
MIQHLELHLPETCPSVAVHTFSSVSSKEFGDFLEESPIYFVMAHDGSLRTEGKAVVENAADKRAKILLRGMILWFNTHQLNVALINQNDIRDSKVCL